MLHVCLMLAPTVFQAYVLLVSDGLLGCNAVWTLGRYNVSE
jgi:hypothetical protein